MKVPSYDDLTPSIPDIHPRDTFDQVTRLVPADAPVVDARRQASVTDPRALFACITIRNRAHGTAVMALAREFSPRIERHGDDCVVLDVSGLGRLLGAGVGPQRLRHDPVVGQGRVRLLRRGGFDVALHDAAVGPDHASEEVSHDNSVP